MDVNTLRIAATLACFALFMGILVWSFSRAQRPLFDEAARIPFDHDEGAAT
jgi:cytochrome c oxidase cbb3-type subunit 4